MSLGFHTRPEKSLEHYLTRLVKQGVDIEQVYIYSLKRTSGDVYVVLYGHFRGKKQAVAGLKALPDELGANGPIPRTVRGIINDLNG